MWKYSALTHKLVTGGSVPRCDILLGLYLGVLTFFFFLIPDLTFPTAKR